MHTHTAVSGNHFHVEVGIKRLVNPDKFSSASSKQSVYAYSSNPGLLLSQEGVCVQILIKDDRSTLQEGKIDDKSSR